MVRYATERKYGEPMVGVLGNQLTRSKSNLLQQEFPHRKRKLKSVLVRIKTYNGAQAYCRARWGEKWVPIILDTKSLEQSDLHEDDSFEWIPRADEVVKPEDIIHHPRRFTEKEVRDSRRTFENFRRTSKPFVR